MLKKRRKDSAYDAVENEAERSLTDVEEIDEKAALVKKNTLLMNRIWAAFGALALFVGYFALPNLFYSIFSQDAMANNGTVKLLASSMGFFVYFFFLIRFYMKRSHKTGEELSDVLQLYPRSLECKPALICCLLGVSLNLFIGAALALLPFPEQLIADIKAVERELDNLLKGYDSGQKMLRGVPAAIIGSPNVGKSTLLNLVAGFDKAIVSSEAGTTRDILEERVTIGGVTLLLADTAGIREEAGGEIEQIGISRAKKRLENSNLILAVFDQGRPLNDDDRALIAELKGRPVIAVLNKGDLEEKIEKEEIYREFSHVTELTATDPESIKTLSQAVSDFLGTSGFDADAPLLANERQRGCAQRARQAVRDALEGVEMGLTLDVCYALLDEALGALYDLSGENASEEVINAVFDRFCVGK